MKFKLKPVDEIPEPKIDSVEFSLLPISKQQFEEDIARARKRNRRRGGHLHVDELELKWLRENWGITSRPKVR